MNQQRHCVLFAVFMLMWAAGCATDPRFGELPRGAVSTSETHGVAAEICREHLFDPEAASVKLPTGYRLTLAAEAANKNPALETLLRTHPKLRSYATGSLCFLSVGSFVVDSTPTQGVDPMPVAFWWASASGPRHADMRGKAEWVQLGSWYPSNTRNRQAILKTDPMAEFVEIEVAQIEPNVWRLRLMVPGETVVAEVRSSGNRTRSSAAQPGYMSVPMSGGSTGFFSVYTYFGHFHQSAQGTWRATGRGIFTDALAIPGEADVFGTVFEEGWASRSGLYRFSPR